MTWYTIEFDYNEKGQATYRLRVKWWHPAFWLEAYQTLRAGGASIFDSIRYSIVLAWQVKK